MRRKDREMDREFGLQVIDNSIYGTLAVLDSENKINNIPLSIIRDGEYLYFHSAKAGKKVDIFKKEPDVCISFVIDTNIPDNFSPSELESFKGDKSKAKELISNVFTTEFASTIVHGKVIPVEEKNIKINTLKLICEKYTPDKMEFFQLAVEAGLERVNIYQIKIDEISSKRKKYDSKGVEMKWMRLE